MANPKLQPVPKPEPPETLRLGLTGKYAGQWVEYRVTPTVDEFIAFYSGDEGRIYQAAKQRVIKHSFGGDIGDQPMPVMIAIIRAWTQRDEEEALDPKADSDSDSS